MSRRVYQRVGVERHHLRRIGGVPAAVGVNARWDDLVAGWLLDESSDGSAPVARADVLGTYELTDNNTVPSGTGKNGDAASFTSTNSEFLSSADDGLAFGPGDGSFTITFWQNISTQTGLHVVAARDHNTSREWLLYNSGGNLQFYVFNTSTASVNVQIANDLNTWKQYILWWDASTSKVSMVEDNGTPVVSSALTGTPKSGSAAQNFTIGARTFPGSAAYFDGLIDDLYVFNTNIGSDSDWRTGMWNSGAGRSFPD